MAWVLAAVCGVILAGGVHTVKAGGRPVLTATTGGVANPIVSTLEDVLSALTSFLSVVAPYLVGLFLLVILSLTGWWVVRRRRRAE